MLSFEGIFIKKKIVIVPIEWLPDTTIEKNIFWYTNKIKKIWDPSKKNVILYLLRNLPDQITVGYNLLTHAIQIYIYNMDAFTFHIPNSLSFEDQSKNTLYKSISRYFKTIYFQVSVSVICEHKYTIKFIIMQFGENQHIHVWYHSWLRIITKTIFLKLTKTTIIMYAYKM